MESNEGSAEGVSSAQFVEMVVRTLRHEIGDLLQSIYSAVAILQERLPRSQTLEHTILADLRGRAETCKNELDATHDLVCPLNLNLDWVDLGELAAGLAASWAVRFPALQVVCAVAQPLKAWTDAPRLMQAATLLTGALCQTARRKVEIRGNPPNSSGIVELRFCCDGPPINAEQLRWLDAPFGTTRQARFGLGLALARRIVASQGGRVTVGGPENDFHVALVLPPGPADE